MQRIVRSLIVAALFVVFVPSVASAQAKKGDTEALLFATIQSQRFEGGSNTFGLIFANIGKYLTDTWEVGGGPSISISSSGGDTDTTVGGNGFVRRSFIGSNPKMVPYAGLELSISDFSETGDTMFGQLIGGVKNYISERAALDFKGFFGLSVKHPGDLQNFGVQVGLSVVF